MTGVQEEYQARSVLVVMAHPDDAEFMAGGLIAKWSQEGKEINYVLSTAGDKGSSDPKMTQSQLAEIRRAEQREACNRFGAKELVFLGYEDGVLQNTLGLRRDIVREIRRFKPDIVLCQDPTARWTPNGTINHPDHRATGDAAVDAVFPSARDRMVFPELLCEGFEAHKVKEIYMAYTITPDVWVDVEGSMDLKIHALRAHVSQVGTGPRPDRPGWVLEDVVRERAAAIGEPQGLKYAESYKYIRLP